MFFHGVFLVNLGNPNRLGQGFQVHIRQRFVSGFEQIKPPRRPPAQVSSSHPLYAIQLHNSQCVLRVHVDRANRELQLTPVVVARTERERVLVEASVNSVRISLGIKQADDLERVLCKKFTGYMAKRADKFQILRRKPAVEGYL